MRRLAVVIAALLITAIAATPAQARLAAHDNVGVIFGEYFVAPADYDGWFGPAYSGQCVRVQRKAAGVWRDNVTNGLDCSVGAQDWWIHDNTLASNTDAVRLVVVSGPYSGSYKVLCTSPSDCQQM